MCNLPPGETDSTLEERDTDFEDTDTGLLDDDSDEFDCLEARLAPLLTNE